MCSALVRCTSSHVLTRSRSFIETGTVIELVTGIKTELCFFLVLVDFAKQSKLFNMLQEFSLDAVFFLFSIPFMLHTHPKSTSE